MMFYIVIIIIGASLSEPHNGEVNEPPVRLYIYMWRYDRLEAPVAVIILKVPLISNVSAHTWLASAITL